MATNRSAPTATVVPVLIYDDVGRASEWLCRAFGFTERLRAERGGVVGHVQLSVAEGAIMLGQKGGPFSAAEANHMSQYVLVHVADVDRHFAQAKASGARILQEPADMPFGERQYTAEDHAGHWWTFSQHVADVAPEAWGGKVTA